MFMRNLFPPPGLSAICSQEPSCWDEIFKGVKNMKGSDLFKILSNIPLENLEKMDVFVDVSGHKQSIKNIEIKKSYESSHPAGTAVTENYMLFK